MCSETQAAKARHPQPSATVTHEEGAFSEDIPSPKADCYLSPCTGSLRLRQSGRDTCMVDSQQNLASIASGVEEAVVIRIFRLNYIFAELRRNLSSGNCFQR